MTVNLDLLRKHPPTEQVKSYEFSQESEMGIFIGTELRIFRKIYYHGIRTDYNGGSTTKSKRKSS